MRRLALALTAVVAALLLFAAAAGAAASSCPIRAASASQYAKLVRSTHGLVAYWRLADASGTIACDSRGANAGRYSPGWSVAPDSAVATDTDRAGTLRAGAFIRVPPRRALSPRHQLTLETWVKPDTSSGARAVLRKGDQYLLALTGSSVLLRVWNHGSVVGLRSRSIMRAGTWQHLVATVDRRWMRLYRNGVLVAARHRSGPIGTNSSPLYLGSDRGRRRFRGSMDDTAVYRVALRRGQVAAHYRAAVAAGTPGGAVPAPAPDPAGPPAAPPPPRCTLYAAPHGSSSASGSSKDAPTTLGSAAGKAVPGSIVCLEAGTYNISSNFMLKRSGTRSAPITYRNYVGGALLQYTGSALTGGVLQVADGADWGGAHDIVIDGLTIDGANLIGSGVFVSTGAHHVTVRNCVIRNTGSAGIVFNSNDYVSAEHNLISHTGYKQGTSSAISLWNGGEDPTYGGRTAWFDTAPGFHNTIVANIISGAYDATDHMDGNAIIVDGSGSIPPALIADNLTYENGGRGIEVNHSTGDVWVINNTAYANGLDLKVGDGQAPDLMANVAENVHFVNNIGYGRVNGSTFSDAYTYNNTQSTIAWSHNLAFNGTTSGVSSSVTADPVQYRFADPLFAAAPPVPAGSSPWASAVAPWSIADGLTTQPGSPAIDAGIDPRTVAGMTSPLAAGLDAHMATDLGGAPRTQGAATDMGAYER